MAIIIASSAAWLCFDGSGLPDVRSMRGLVEPVTVPISVECLSGHPVVIPYESLGANARYALAAAVAPEDGPSVLAAVRNRNGGSSSAMFVSRRILCREEKPLLRSIDEIRTAIQLERRYSKQDLFTMLANSAYFGDGIVGIEAASLHYFQKHSQELHIEEAALLAGLISRPNYFSPIAHPDRAFTRRNQVIEMMLQKKFITPTDASLAETAPFP